MSILSSTLDLQLDGQQRLTAYAPDARDRTAPAVLGSYVAAARQVGQDAGLPAAWCIIAAELATAVLPKLGLRRVQTVGVQMAAFNPAAATLMRAGVPSDRWPSTAWSGGVEGTGTTDRRGWDGHLVSLVCESGSGRRRYWLLDPTADQVNAPGRGLSLMPIMTEVPPDMRNGQPLRLHTPDGATLHYRRIHGLEQTAVIPPWSDKVLMPALAEQVLAIRDQNRRKAIARGVAAELGDLPSSAASGATLLDVNLNSAVDEKLALRIRWWRAAVGHHPATRLLIEQRAEHRRNALCVLGAVRPARTVFESESAPRVELRPAETDAPVRICR